MKHLAMLIFFIFCFTSYQSLAFDNESDEIDCSSHTACTGKINAEHFSLVSQYIYEVILGEAPKPTFEVTCGQQSKHVWSCMLDDTEPRAGVASHWHVRFDLDSGEYRFIFGE